MSVETGAVLDFLRDLVRIHHASDAERRHRRALVSALLGERARWSGLVSEVVSSEGGALVDATRSGSGVRCGRINEEAPELVAALQETVAAYNVVDSTAALRLSISNERAVIEGAQDLSAANTAQRGVRELLTALCSDVLRSAQLAALVFSAEAFDRELMGLVWPLLMRLDVLLGDDPRSTVAVVAGDAMLDVGIQCVGEPSLLYDIGESGLARRHPFLRSVEPLDLLARTTDGEAPLLVFVLGAGASAQWGLPLGNSLRDDALARLTGEHVDASTFEKVARGWYGHLAATSRLSTAEDAAGAQAFVDRLTLERVVQHEQFEEKRDFSYTLRDFSRRHAEVDARIRSRSEDLVEADPLRRVCAIQKRLVLVTVNFDQTIEARCGDLVRPVVGEADLAAFPARIATYAAEGGPIPLLKLHGDIGEPSTLVANLRQTAAGLGALRQAAITSLIDLVADQEVRPWYYVGYSMRDQDLEGTWTSSAVPGFAEEWVTPFVDESVRNFIDHRRRVQWERQSRDESADDRHITLTAGEFFSELAHRLVGNPPT